MRISSVSFTRDLSKAYIYVENAATRELRISGVYVGGEDATSSADVKQAELKPGDKTLVVVERDRPFRRGEVVKLRVEAGQVAASAEVRALPAEFPVGIYGGDEVLSNRQALMEVLEMGLDTLVAGPDKLEAARRHGLRVVAYAPRAGESIDLDAVRRYAGHPALLAWYVVDEPDIWEAGGRLPEGWTAKWTGEVRKADPATPTYIVLCDPWSLERFASLPDILAVDPYPVSHLPLRYVEFMARRAVRAAAPRPVWLIPQAFRHGRPPRSGGWWWNRFPTPEEERLMVFMGLGQGLKGVIYFTYHSFIDNPNDPVEGVSSSHVDAAALRRGIARMSGELHALGRLLAFSDVFTETRSAAAWSRSGSVEAASLVAGDEAVVLVLVNHGYVSTPRGFEVAPAREVVVEARIPRWIKVLGAYRVAEWGVEDVELKVEGGVARITLPRLETAAAVVLAASDSAYRALVEEWRIWRRY